MDTLALLTLAQQLGPGPAVIATRTTAQTGITNNVDTPINFTATLVNTDSMWTGGSPATITVQHSGLYLIAGCIPWPTIVSPTLATVATANLWYNGTGAGNTIAADTRPFTSSGAAIPAQFARPYLLNANDTLQLDAFQSSGATQATATYGGGCWLAVIRLMAQ